MTKVKVMEDTGDEADDPPSDEGVVDEVGHILECLPVVFTGRQITVVAAELNAN